MCVTIYKCNLGLRLTDTFTDAHCFDSNNTIIQGSDLSKNPDTILLDLLRYILMVSPRHFKIFGYPFERKRRR